MGSRDQYAPGAAFGAEVRKDGEEWTLVLVRDSYPSLGWGGQHLQPPRAVAAALRRDDGREGGVLAVVPVDGAKPLQGLVRELGLDVGIWDNGTRR